MNWVPENAEWFWQKTHPALYQDLQLARILYDNLPEFAYNHYGKQIENTLNRAREDGTITPGPDCEILFAMLIEPKEKCIWFTFGFARNNKALSPMLPLAKVAMGEPVKPKWKMKGVVPKGHVTRELLVDFDVSLKDLFAELGIEPWKEWP